MQGRIQDFKLGGALKKIASSRGRRENFGVFRVKNHDFTRINHIFPILGGERGGAPDAPHPESAPVMCSYVLSMRTHVVFTLFVFVCV